MAFYDNNAYNKPNSSSHKGQTCPALFFSGILIFNQLLSAPLKLFRVMLPVFLIIYRTTEHIKLASVLLSIDSYLSPKPLWFSYCNTLYMTTICHVFFFILFQESYPHIGAVMVQTFWKMLCCRVRTTLAFSYPVSV